MLTLERTILDLIADLLWTSSINLAANREASSENFENSSLKTLGHRLVGTSHCAGNLNNLIERDGLGVLNVLLLLSVSWWLLEGTDYEG